MPFRQTDAGTAATHDAWLHSRRIRVRGILPELGFQSIQNGVVGIRVIRGDQGGFKYGPVGDFLAVGHLVKQFGGAPGFLVERLGY